MTKWLVAVVPILSKRLVINPLMPPDGQRSLSSVAILSPPTPPASDTTGIYTNPLPDPVYPPSPALVYPPPPNLVYPYPPTSRNSQSSTISIPMTDTPPQVIHTIPPPQAIHIIPPPPPARITRRAYYTREHLPLVSSRTTIKVLLRALETCASQLSVHDICVYITQIIEKIDQTPSMQGIEFADFWVSVFDHILGRPGDHSQEDAKHHEQTWGREVESLMAKHVPTVHILWNEAQWKAIITTTRFKHLQDYIARHHASLSSIPRQYLYVSPLSMPSNYSYN